MKMTRQRLDPAATLSLRPRRVLFLCGVRVDGDRRRVVTTDAPGPAGRVVGENGAVGTELVDQGRGIIRAGQLRQTGFCPVRFPAGPARRMAMAARYGRIGSSRT
jgi:hypothetical protein